MRALFLRLLLAGWIALSPSAGAERKDEPLPPSKLKPLAVPAMVERLRPLYSLTVDEPPAGGKESKLTVQEKQRNERTSVVAYTYISGPSVGTSMTAMFASYRIALDRGAKFFVVLQTNETRRPTEFLVGFSDEKVAAPAKYFDVTGPLDEDLRWMSVAELETVFTKFK